MARPKSWISRIAHILSYLEADSAERYRRADVEKLFSVSASQAKDLMEVSGAREARPGMERTVSRSNLLAYVKHSPEAQDALQEIERRKKLASKLRLAEQDLKFRNVRMRVTKEDEWARFAELPNVAIQPGLLQVAFTPGDPVDVLDTLFRFLKACGNEWDEFARMCAPPAATAEMAADAGTLAATADSAATAEMAGGLSE